MGLTNSRVVQTPEFLQPNVRRQFALTPNIRLNLGGADRDRTGGLLVANQALSQLSYSPNRKFQSFTFQSFKIFETLKLCNLET
jgi:hypothetical protein